MLPSMNAQNAEPSLSKEKAGNTGHKYQQVQRSWNHVEFVGNAIINTKTGAIKTVPYMRRKK